MRRAGPRAACWHHGSHVHAHRRVLKGARAAPARHLDPAPAAAMAPAPGPAARLLAWLGERAPQLVLVFWGLAVAGFFLMPLASRAVYLDERALLVGGAAPTIR